jgi:hypothetical protein
MCFSASASFIAGGALTAMGGASLLAAKKENKVLAAVPLLFGIQQISEGIQWLYLNAGSTSPAAGYFFLIFALIVWPLYVPAFVYLLDEKKKKKILRWFIFLGMFIASYFSLLMLKESIVITKVNACIQYSFNSHLEEPILFVYLFAILGPLFFSSHKFFRWFGIATFFSAVISLIFFSFSFTSVWCFFAALLSVIILVYVYKPKLLNLQIKLPG